MAGDRSQFCPEEPSPPSPTHLERDSQWSTGSVGSQWALPWPRDAQGVATQCGQSHGGRSPTAGPKCKHLQVIEGHRPSWAAHLKGGPRSTSGWGKGTAVTTGPSALRTNSRCKLWVELNWEDQGSKRDLSTWSVEGEPGSDQRKEEATCQHDGRATGGGGLGPLDEAGTPCPTPRRQRCSSLCYVLACQVYRTA